MNLIAAVDRNWAIGRNNQLLVTVPADQRLFREETLGKVVVMGRRTLEGLPGGKPLPGRTTIVMSQNPGYEARGALVAHGVKELLRMVEPYPGEDVFVAGGAEIYRLLLPWCGTAHITYIDYAYEADAYAPDLDRDGDWKLKLAGEEQTYFDLCYEYRMYVRTGKLRPGIKHG